MSRLILAVVTLTLCGCLGMTRLAVASDWQALPTPTTGAGHAPVRLRVVHAFNPRFPMLSHAQVEAILKSAARLAEEHLSLRVQFDTPPTAPLSHLFARVPEAPRVWLERERFRGWDDDESVSALANAFHASLRRARHSLDALVEYARPHLEYGADAPDLWTFMTVLLAHEKHRQEPWLRRELHDGKPIMHSDGFHEWDRWAVVGYGELDYDIVITNQLIVGSSRQGSSVHSAIRGSVAVGSTFYNLMGASDAYAVLSVAPFEDYFAGIRGDGEYAPALRSDLAGAVLAHELGHLLRRYGHPYAHAACLMRPTPMFGFRAWYAGLDAKACAANDAKQMRAGAIPLYRNADW